jgi:malic enzyme
MLPLSNPSACAEARPEDILTWTEGRALVASGGPSRDVRGPTGVRVIGQANNVFVFPGVGLGAIVSETREVTDGMFLAAAHELASLVSDDRLRDGAIYPRIAGLRAVARAIAVAVVREARDSGHGRVHSDEEIEPAVDHAMWWPAYVPFEPGD